MTFKDGDRVRLAAQPNQNLPEELGTVCGLSNTWTTIDGRKVYIVRLDEEFRQPTNRIEFLDDGLREVTEDQMKVLR